jgi:hypothetical protein
MTLIAALKIEGVPALIGDFLVTDNRPSAGHDWIPTQPYLNDPNYPNKLQRRISGAKRKLHLINDYFIVGFTGDVDAGAAIFSALESGLGNTKRGPSIMEISRALESFNIPYHKKATVIGWTAGPKPRCFKWTANPGSTATHVTHAIEGSGSRHFADLLTNARSGGYRAGVNTAFEKAILLGLAKVGGILTEELRAATNLKEYYGYGGEIALFNGRRFQFISQVGYVFWNALIDLDGSIKITRPTIIAAYEAKSRYCLFQVTHLDVAYPTPIAINCPRATNIYLHAIGPMHDNLSGLKVTSSDMISDESIKYYFNAIAVRDLRSNKTFTLKSTSIMEETSAFRVFRRDGLRIFEWHRPTLEEMILTAAERANA